MLAASNLSDITVSVSETLMRRVGAQYKTFSGRWSFVDAKRPQWSPADAVCSPSDHEFIENDTQKTAFAPSNFHCF